ncbi:O-antigen ligase family protein [Devosia sp. PTR5]|uniref:O-antigen ligase family protein n=1 Tax=Devosia oryzisoli TaxID=2774138 RepID=A0A927ISZ1_9HYPH|nr:O-antigen ligase family protein [Devosia oryzisoli]MBD8066004.1 O-antigen ligase family protein [Devosia oryzisoli]
MAASLSKIVILISIVAISAMAPVAPEAANVIWLASGLTGLFLLRRKDVALLRRPVVWMSLAALSLMAIAYVAGSRSLGGLIGLVYFVPLFVIWPLMAAAKRAAAAGPGLGSGQWSLLLGVLGLCGVAGAAVIAINEVATTMTERAGGTVANPIHFADVALLAGALSTAGLLSGNRARYVFLLGPVLALGAVILSGTRGAVVAAAVMLLTAIAVAAMLRLISLKAVLLLIGSFVVVGVVGALLGASQLSGIQRVLADFGDVVRTGLPTDHSTSLRLQMYLGGLRAFMQSPIYGHGPMDFTSVAGALADTPFQNVPHLHNDLADFAASAGIIGLVVYALLMLAPIAEVASAPASRAKYELLVLVITLVTGFVVMGLTNAMFGILNVTTSYAGLSVIAGLLAGSITNEHQVGRLQNP